MTKTIALLGATGSIGRQTLEVAGELVMDAAEKYGAAIRSEERRVGKEC